MFGPVNFFFRLAFIVAFVSILYKYVLNKLQKIQTVPFFFFSNIFFLLNIMFRSERERERERERQKRENRIFILIGKQSKQKEKTTAK